MDENNLDSLLDELSSMDGELNQNIDADAGTNLDVGDLDDISLDELDKMDRMDLGDLDFDDIDFDDVDITKLDSGANPVIQKKQPSEDMNLDSLIEKANQESAAVKAEEKPEERKEESKKNDDVFGDADMQMQEDTELPDGIFDNLSFDQITDHTDKKQDDFSDLPGGTEKEKSYTSGEAGLDELLQNSMAESLKNGELDDIIDIGEKKGRSTKTSKVSKADPKKSKAPDETTQHKKKTISEILFGEPDDDDLEEEAFFEEKKAKKEEERAAGRKTRRKES